MKSVLERINGLVKIKVDSFKKACILNSITFKEPNYIIARFDPYFAGLIDTDGSIIFNLASNRIECVIELKYNSYTSQLNFDYVIGCKAFRALRTKKNQDKGKEFYSISFKFQTVESMLPLYEYFMVNRLYSDFKFYRISKIKQFIAIRHFNKSPRDTPEYQVYSNFVLN
jgi:hypothetical protein